mmetsp:Transcript_6419/g.15540  ORF Transcript_6419/g.15540 Transcript_6419/m.15540 type:complete len:241 (+) Transcript_6419:1367-2089(+)
MRCPHHSCREMHQSRMLASQSCHFFLCTGGMIVNRPSFAAASASFAMFFESTYHCGFNTGSITSLVRDETGIRMPGLGREPLYSPRSVRSLMISWRALNRCMPLYFSPHATLRVPSSLRMLMNSSLCLLPMMKSLGSCAGVTFTAPVPKSISTASESWMMGMRRPVIGWTRNFPWNFLYRSSSGWTATAESPNIVSGRVVAITISSSESSTLYAHSQNIPNSTLRSKPGTEILSGCSSVM